MKRSDDGVMSREEFGRLCEDLFEKVLELVSSNPDCNDHVVICVLTAIIRKMADEEGSRHFLDLAIMGLREWSHEK